MPTGDDLLDTPTKIAASAVPKSLLERGRHKLLPSREFESVSGKCKDQNWRPQQVYPRVRRHKTSPPPRKMALLGQLPFGILPTKQRISVRTNSDNRRGWRVGGKIATITLAFNKLASQQPSVFPKKILTESCKTIIFIWLREVAVSGSIGKTLFYHDIYYTSLLSLHLLRHRGSAIVNVLGCLCRTHSGYGCV